MPEDIRPYKDGFPIIAIIVADFYPEIADNLLNAALQTLTRAGIAEKDIVTLRVPGAFEVPFAAELAHRRLKPRAIITLGAVIRGETPHFDYVCRACVDGLQKMNSPGPSALNSEDRPCCPVLFGILTVDNRNQASARSTPLAQLDPSRPASNKGAETAEAALRMIRLVDGTGPGLPARLVESEQGGSW